MALGKQVDIHVDQVIRKMVGEGVLRVLSVLSLLGEGFKVLRVDISTLYMWIRLEREQTLQGTPCPAKKSAVPEVGKMSYPAACRF